MNTYSKFVPNVFLAKCPDPYQKGDVIMVTTRHGRENESIVYNLMFEKDGFFFYSIVRSDGFNVQQHALNRAERLHNAANNAETKSNSYFEASRRHHDFLKMGEPIKVGHHSERRHRKIIDQAANNMDRCVEYSKKSEMYDQRAEYWKGKANTINLSMPESIDYFEYELDKAKRKHEGLKNGSLPREHSFSLTYAKKEVNEISKKLELARRLWQ